MAATLRRTWIARKDRTDDAVELVHVDESASDDVHWRGYTADNHWSAWAKATHEEVPTPAWAKDW